MRFRWKSAVVSAFAASLSACGEGSTPPGDVNMLIDFCLADTPDFFAFQNDGEDWTRVTADGNGTFAFDAEERLTLAFVQQTGNSFETEIVFTTRDELEVINGVACKEDLGTKTLNGTVAGVGVSEGAQITMGSASDFTVGAPFTLLDVPAGNIDLVASREVSNATIAVPNRVIVRRSVNYSSTIPVLNFAAAEAEAPTTHVATMANTAGSGESNFLQVFFVTTAGTTHSFFYNDGFTTSAQAIYGMPSTQAGDYHALTLFAGPADLTSTRAVVRYYRTPGDKSLTLGPAINTPIYSIVSSSPYTRLRSQLVVQNDYNRAVAFAFAQQTVSTEREWTVTATAGYFGGNAPTTWDVTMPDLSGVTGFPSSAGLQAGLTTATLVEASNARPALFFAPDLTAPLEDETQNFAFRELTTNTAVVPAAARVARRKHVGIRSPFRARSF